MTDDSREGLARECRALTRYLVGVEATDYVVGKYVSAHGISKALAPSGNFDRLLVRMASGPAALRSLATAFARVHAPRSALQNKLVTLLAILETAPPSSRVVDSVPDRRPMWLLIRLGLRVTWSILALVMGTIFLVPARWASAVRASTR